MLKKIKYYLILLILLVCLSFTIINPSIIYKDIIEATNIFIYKLFPAMFFFYTLADLLINYGFLNILEPIFNKIFLKLFHISGTSSFIVITSVISGFPSGAKYITNFLDKNLICKDEAEYLLTFTHFSNPLFILGTIALIYSKKIALTILICHYLSNFILAFLIRPKEVAIAKIPPKIKRESLATALSISFKNSFKILLLIFFNTIFFYTFSDIFTFFIKDDLIKSIIYGLFDLTKGIITLNSINITMFFKILLITSFLSFGGVSVHFQVKEIISSNNLNYKYFLLGRISSIAIGIIILTTFSAIGII